MRCDTLIIVKLTEQFEATLRTDGLLAAMRWLNSTVPYRYTAIFAFDGDLLRNVCLVDKENPAITRCGDQSIMDSYCIYIHRSHEKFVVEEASQDERIEGHPKRHEYQCYYGIPLFATDGKMLGTVCHFGKAAVSVTAGVVTGLDDLAVVIADAAFGKVAEGEGYDG